jgi:hypothetical protein
MSHWPVRRGEHRYRSEGNEVSAVVFTLLFGLLSGIAGFVGSAWFETVLMLGLLGLTHLTVVAGRQANGKIIREDIQR